MYYEFNVGNETYKLRLNTRNLITLEKQIGCNPLSIFGNGDTIPTISTMVTILHTSLQQYHHNIKLDDAYEIFDKYLEDNTATDFIPVIIEIYKVSGIIKAETPKN
jgi:hypothetical protein